MSSKKTRKQKPLYSSASKTDPQHWTYRILRKYWLTVGIVALVLAIGRVLNRAPKASADVMSFVVEIAVTLVIAFVVSLVIHAIVDWCIRQKDEA